MYDLFLVNNMHIRNYLFILLLCVPNVEARSIAFFFALDQDWETFRKELSAEPGTKEIGGQTVYELRSGENKIFAVKMGSGCVNTAISAQSLLSVRKCDLAISAGVVGALSLDLKVGEECLVANVVAWQKESSSKNFLQWKRAEWKDSGRLKPINVASGEVFVTSEELKDEVREKTECDAVDMNLFGLLSVLDRQQVSSIHFRIVSDLADERAATQFQEFLTAYQGEGGKMAAAFVRALPLDSTSPMNFPKLKELFTPPEPRDEKTSVPKP